MIEIKIWYTQQEILSYLYARGFTIEEVDESTDEYNTNKYLVCYQGDEKEKTLFYKNHRIEQVFGNLIREKLYQL